MVDVRKCYRVTKAFSATNVGDDDLCSAIAGAETKDTTINKDDYVWAYPETDGFIRFTKGTFAVLCVRSEIFLKCTERHIAELEEVKH
jgi:hypothetical protein